MKKLLKLLFLIFIFSFTFIVFTWGDNIWGDVDSNDRIDILDALLVAQYYVGIDDNIDCIPCGDVWCKNADNTYITIVDALLIAQYYVELRSYFPCRNSPTPTPSPTPASTHTPSVTASTATPASTALGSNAPAWGFIEKNKILNNKIITNGEDLSYFPQVKIRLFLYFSFYFFGFYELRYI